MKTQSNSPYGSFIPLTKEFYDDPYPFYRRLREEAPIFWDQNLHSWLLTSYSDIVNGLKDNRLSAERGYSYFGMLPSKELDELEPLREFFAQWMLFSDPPYHDKIKRLVIKAFAPKIVKDVEPYIESVAVSLIRDLDRNDEIDVIAQYAVPLSVQTISKVMGIPPEEYARIVGWTDDIVGFMGTGVPQIERGRSALKSLDQLREYLGATFEARRKHPRPDLITQLVQVRDQGEELNEEELLATCANLLIDGHEPSSLALGNGVYELARNGNELEQLVKNPSLINWAIEEILRFHPPFAYIARRANEEITIRDMQIKKDDRVVMLLGAANRDPEYFSEPDNFRINRSENRHLTFGQGSHYCLGAFLGRTTIGIGINKLLERYPHIQFSPKGINWRQSLGFRGLVSLWVTTK